jgi:hypothetical protein
MEKNKVIYICYKLIILGCYSVWKVNGVKSIEETGVEDLIEIRVKGKYVRKDPLELTKSGTIFKR